MARALALFVAGTWMGLLVASWMIASITFRTAATLAQAERAPALHERLAGVPADGRLQVLRHVASEVNRAMFGRWIVIQIVLGALALGLAFRAAGPWAIAAAALAITLVQAGLHTPILEIGRAIDFVPRPLPADVGARFGRLHGAYVLLDLAKAGTLLWLAWRLVRLTR